MAEEVLKQIPYREKTIDVVMTCGKVRFTVKNDANQWWFDSMDAAQKKIDQLVSATAAARTNAVKVKLPVYDLHGVPMVIVGLNRSTGEAKVTDYNKTLRYGEKATGYKGDVYPQVAWVLELVKRQIALQDELNEISRKLYKVKTEVGRHWGSRKPAIDIEHYEPKVRAMAAEIEGKTKLAQQTEVFDPKPMVSA